MEKHIFLLLSLCLVMVSCQKDEDEEPFININQTQFTVSNLGGSQTIPFEANMNWTAQSTESWCTVTPSNGNSSTNVTTVSLTKNDTYETRSCSIIITAGRLSKTIIINQSSNSGLLVTKDKYELTNDASIIEVEVKANVEYEVTLSDDWITQATTRGLSATNLSFNIAKNTSYDNREGTITIKQKGGALSSTIKVYQSQKDAIILSNKIKDISNDTQTLEVELKTNVDFEVIIQEAAKSWVTYTPTRGLRTETLLLNIAANEIYDARTTEVYVKNKATNFQDTLTINQTANRGLIVTQDKYELTNNEATIEVVIKTNIEYDVSISDKWITKADIIKTRGLTSIKLAFDIAENNTSDDREGTITIKQKNGTLTRTIKIYQSKNENIWKDNNEIAFANTAASSEYKTIESASKMGSIAYKVIKTGTGNTPLYNDKVKVLYEGWFKFVDWNKNDTYTNEDGITVKNKYVFDSTANRNNVPSIFDVYSVMDGFSTALQHMKVGDKWEVWMPWRLGYGANASNTIPAYTTLVFEIELVAII